MMRVVCRSGPTQSRRSSWWAKDCWVLFLAVEFFGKKLEVLHVTTRDKNSRSFFFVSVLHSKTLLLPSATCVQAAKAEGACAFPRPDAVALDSLLSAVRDLLPELGEGFVLVSPDSHPHRHCYQSSCQLVLSIFLPIRCYQSSLPASATSHPPFTAACDAVWWPPLFVCCVSQLALQHLVWTSLLCSLS